MTVLHHYISKFFPFSFFFKNLFQRSLQLICLFKTLVICNLSCWMSQKSSLQLLFTSFILLVSFCSTRFSPPMLKEEKKCYENCSQKKEKPKKKENKNKTKQTLVALNCSIPANTPEGLFPVARESFRRK